MHVFILQQRPGSTNSAIIHTDCSAQLAFRVSAHSGSTPLFPDQHHRNELLLPDHHYFFLHPSFNLPARPSQERERCGEEEEVRACSPGTAGRL